MVCLSVVEGSEMQRFSVLDYGQWMCVGCMDCMNNKMSVGINEGQLSPKKTLCASCQKVIESMILKELLPAVGEVDLHIFEQRGQGEQVEEYMNI
jgi:hypothetical protein